jgi:SAM-dependent methyltransferase
MFDRANQYLDPSSAVDYSQNNDIQFNQSTGFINQYLRLFKGPVLDLGCGDGKVTAYIAEKIGEPITGVDISAERVSLANQTYANTTLNFVVDNIAALNAVNWGAAVNYGTIVSFNTLHHIPKPQQAGVFLKTKELLRSDGIALFLIPGRSKEMHDAILETYTHETWRKYFTDFDLDAVRTYEGGDYYKNLFLKSGFYHCDVDSVEESGGKELDAQGMKKFLAGWLPHLVHLRLKKPELEDALLDDIVKLFFVKMKKDITATVNPVIAQNKISAYASEAAFFQRAKLSIPKKSEVQKSIVDAEKDSSRLTLT